MITGAHMWYAYLVPVMIIIFKKLTKKYIKNWKFSTRVGTIVDQKSTEWYITLKHNKTIYPYCVFLFWYGMHSG